jgi:hypothetical protein
VLAIHTVTTTKNYNRIVSSFHAASANEAHEFVAHLPTGVAKNLDVTLRRGGYTVRYDADEKRAYYIKLDGVSVAIWMWDDVRNQMEAAMVFAVAAAANRPLTGSDATHAYQLAVGRAVDAVR